jgi:hypothetical protein
MAAFGSTILTMVCGSVVTLLVFSLVTLLQNTPAILSAVLELLQVFIRISVSCYRTLLESLVPNLIIQPGFRLVATTTLSILICAGVLILTVEGLVEWPFILAVIHGLVVGISWDDANRSDHFNLGVDL